MWLTLDLGNSSVKGGLFEADQLTETFRIQYAEHDDWLDMLAERIQDPSIDRIGFASVVPEWTPGIARLAEDADIRPPLVVQSDLQLPFEMAYATPNTLGADRLAAAAAAWTLFRDPARSVVAVDAGTAITYEVINGEGVYLGGAIAPGPGLLRHALREGTAQLPDVPLAVPSSPVGRTTQTAMQAGLMHGFIDGVAGMLARLDELLSGRTTVVATGGWSGTVADELPTVDHVEPHLVLYGIRVLMTLNDKIR